MLSFSKMNEESSMKEGSCKVILKIMKSFNQFLLFSHMNASSKCSSWRQHQFRYEVQEEPSHESISLTKMSSC